MLNSTILLVLLKYITTCLDFKLIFKQYITIKISKIKTAFYLIKRLSNI